MTPGWELLLLLLAVVAGRAAGRGGGGGGAEKCLAVQRRCTSRQGCSMALSTYVMSCGPVISGSVGSCTPECRMALIALLSMDDGQGELFMTCDCDGQSMCLEQKARLAVCEREVTLAMPAVLDNSTAISCSQANLICSADTDCFSALTLFHDYCRRLFGRGDRCTRSCRNSLSILHNRAKARKLRSCYCDGAEGYDCEQLQARTAALCLGPPRHGHGADHTRRPPRPQPTPSLRPESNAPWDEEGEEPWEEEVEEPRERDEEREREQEDNVVAASAARHGSVIVWTALWTVMVCSSRVLA